MYLLFLQKTESAIYVQSSLEGRGVPQLGLAGPGLRVGALDGREGERAIRVVRETPGDRPGHGEYLGLIPAEINQDVKIHICTHMYIYIYMHLDIHVSMYVYVSPKCSYKYHICVAGFLKDTMAI